jgi:hypothetical protein
MLKEITSHRHKFVSRIFGLDWNQRLNNDALIGTARKSNSAQLLFSLSHFRSEFYEFCMDEKLGTHLNAPSMYQHHNGSLTADRLPVEMLVRVKGSIHFKILQ